VQDWNSLRDWAARVTGIEPTAAVLHQLHRYVELLLQWNQKVALVSRGDLESVLVKHVADSLVAAAHCGAARTVADLGSGAGFPGLVIAIVHPGTTVCVIESRGKKISFLEEAVRCAAIANAEVLQARIEALAGDPRHRGRYDLITSRALADIDQLLALARPLAVPGARLLAMRAAGAPVPEGAEVVEYELPDGTPRRLVSLAL
jgi:16S rRNA (guanine527-N7)-methyltransferase